MKLTPLASGSSGNSFLVRNNGTAILFDAGLSAKQLAERMNEVSFDPGALNSIVVSHGHSDHIKGVGVLSRKFKIPVWINEPTWKESQRIIGEVHELRLFETGRIFDIAGFKIHPFSVPHDSADCVGFRIMKGTERLGIATDLGTVTGLVQNVLMGLQVLVLESNHDTEMLMTGPYPWELKQRVKSRTGHLSNEAGAKLLTQVMNDDLQAVILAHLSETNNTAETAIECAKGKLGSFLERKGELFCARQDVIGPTVEW